MCPPSGHNANCCVCQVFGATGISIRGSLSAQSRPCHIPILSPLCTVALQCLASWCGVTPLAAFWGFALSLASGKAPLVPLLVGSLQFLQHQNIFLENNHKNLSCLSIAMKRCHLCMPISESMFVWHHKKDKFLGV